MKARRKLIIPFLLPAVLFIAVFFIYPTIQSVIISFQDWDGTFRTTGFVGVDNYRRLFRDPTFKSTIGHTFSYFFIQTLILFPVATALAVALQRMKKGRMAIQFFIFAPVTLSVVVAAVLWKWYMYDPNMGLLNNVLRGIGLGKFAKAWLGNSSTALTAVICMSVWHGVATWVIMIIAGIDRIPPELLEAARLDGASEFQVFVRVVLPLLWEVLSTLLIISFIGAMQQFPVVYAMTQGGPAGATELMGTYLYKVAFEGRKFSYGSAMAVIMAVVILVFSNFGNKFLKTETVEY